MNKVIGQVRRTLQRLVGNALDMIPRAEADEEATRLRQQSDSWRQRYDEMVLLRVSVVDEHNPLSRVVSVRIIVDDVKSISGRDSLLRSVIQQLSKQAGW